MCVMLRLRRTSPLGTEPRISNRTPALLPCKLHTPALTARQLPHGVQTTLKGNSLSYELDPSLCPAYILWLTRFPLRINKHYALPPQADAGSVHCSRCNGQDRHQSWAHWCNTRSGLDQPPSAELWCLDSIVRTNEWAQQDLAGWRA